MPSSVFSKVRIAAVGVAGASSFSGDFCAHAEAEAAFVARALAARGQVIASGQVVDGPAFADYLRRRVRGQPATRPAAQAITECVETKA